MKLDGNHVSVGLPVRSDEELIEVEFVGAICEEHLSVNVSAEAVGNLLDVLWAGSGGRFWAEVEPEAK
jgi:hypothetical protein